MPLWLVLTLAGGGAFLYAKSKVEDAADAVSDTVTGKTSCTVPVVVIAGTAAAGAWWLAKRR